MDNRDIMQTQGKCPCCGYCPHCGRRDAQPYNPVYPFYPAPYYQQPWMTPYTPYCGDIPGGLGTGTAAGGMSVGGATGELITTNTN